VKLPNNSSKRTPGRGANRKVHATWDYLRTRVLARVHLDA
jgi:hypothetical protein